MGFPSRTVPCPCVGGRRLQYLDTKVDFRHNIYNLLACPITTSLRVRFLAQYLLSSPTKALRSKSVLVPRPLSIGLAFLSFLLAGKCQCWKGRGSNKANICRVGRHTRHTAPLEIFCALVGETRKYIEFPHPRFAILLFSPAPLFKHATFSLHSLLFSCAVFLATSSK